MTKRARTRKVSVWIPVDEGGAPWIEWFANTRRAVIRELNSCYVGWREEGMTVQPLKLEWPAPRAAKKARRK